MFQFTCLLILILIVVSLGESENKPSVKFISAQSKSMSLRRKKGTLSNVIETCNTTAAVALTEPKSMKLNDYPLSWIKGPKCPFCKQTISSKFCFFFFFVYRTLIGAYTINI